jgi:pyrroline-5-carboxylate reductase
MEAKIGIIGAGNMGGAFFSGLLKHYSHEQIHIFDKNEEKLKATITHNSFIDDKLIISIMAGVSLAKLKEKTGSEKVVRAMPNLAVKSEKGLTGWIKSDAIENGDEAIVKTIFDSVGTQLEVEDESKLDEITALSGSGPAYFYYLTELLYDKAIEFGFDTEDARKISEQTFTGAASIFNHDSTSAKELKEAVTSKGGTTEAALRHLEENGFDKIFKDALEAAKNRSTELNA